MGDVAAALTWPLTRPPLQPGGRMYVPSMRIRRCLFGTVDHEAAISTVNEGLAESQEKDKQRWNFDFENGRPLAGRFRWERVAGDDPSDADSSGGSATPEEEEQPVRCQQTKITDFMRKRKSSNQKDDFSKQRRKARRRSST